MRKKFLSVLLLTVTLFLSACGQFSFGEETTPDNLQNSAVMPGWQEENGKTVYILNDKTKAVDWLELEGKRYYFDRNGYMQTGWLKVNNSIYYLNSDGSAATGAMVIDGMTHHFTSWGEKILLVNPWNTLPADYQPDLVLLDSSISSKEIYVDRSCYDALNAMIEECNRQSPTVCVISGYRTHEYQTGLYNRKVQSYLDKGYSDKDAKAAAGQVVAVPGTSEHQLGLSVDIIDTRSWSLTSVQETLPGQQWLMENCWRYGFILRYPNGTTDSTGIIYEPWHYRYVGKELAETIHNSKITLEEYLQIYTKGQP